jgi:aminoglycoside phosphotransferase (APT) family kinase protein
MLVFLYNPLGRMITQIENISGRILNEKVLDIKQILNRGQVNETYVLSTASKKYVLRLDPNEHTLDRFKKEAWCAEEANKAGVLTPRVLHMDFIQENPFVILPFIEGVNGDEAPEQAALLWKTLGEYARKIHAIPVKGYGEGMEAPGIFNGSWQKFLDYNISALDPNDKLLKLGVITSAQSQSLKQIFESISKRTFVFGLIHFDLSPNNTIITKEGSVYLLDWGSAEVNVVPHMDLEEILDSSLQDNSDSFELFLQGYGLSRSEYKNIKPEVDMLSLLAKTDKLRWAIDRSPARIEHYKNIVKNKLAKLRI